MTRGLKHEVGLKKAIYKRSKNRETYLTGRCVEEKHWGGKKEL